MNKIPFPQLHTFDCFQMLKYTPHKTLACCLILICTFPLHFHNKTWAVQHLFLFLGHRAHETLVSRTEHWGHEAHRSDTVKSRHSSHCCSRPFNTIQTFRQDQINNTCKYFATVSPLLKLHNFCTSITKLNFYIFAPNHSYIKPI